MACPIIGRSGHSIGGMRSAKPILPWMVWGVATLSYGIAVVNRASLAALGPAAQDHFGIDATTLSMFVMIQLVVYAGMQIPVGTMLDRIGSSRMILGHAPYGHRADDDGHGV